MDNITLNSSTMIIIIVSMVGFLALESILAGTWNRFYFTFGLPIFTRRIPVNVFSFPPLDFESIEAEFSGTWNRKSLVFMELEPGLYAFREKKLEFRGTRSNSEIMHGLLILEQNSQQVVVRGYANWWLFFFGALCAYLGVSLGTQGLLIIGVFLVVMVVVYFLQARRLNKVAEFVAGQVTAGRK